jgi:hypothetical protein
LIRVAHIVNPVKVSENSDLFTAQPITFESIVNAKSQSKNSASISLYTTQYEEDRSIIPAEFEQLSNLERSVLDVNRKLTGKKLPLISDLLAKLNEAEDSDYIIFTNMDIALMPYFYDSVFAYLEKGHDALVINRRRLSHNYSKVEELPLMYADLGKSHPGFDCFVFKTSLLEKFILDDICVGVSFLEAAMVHNIFSFAKNALFIPDAHLTFHIGMDVLVPRNNAYYQHNRRCFFDKIQPQLKPYFELKNFPYNSLPLPKRALKWMLNPSLFTRNYLKLEGKNLFQRTKARLDEIRWRILQR